MLGYSGENVFLAVKQLELGERTLNASTLLMATNILNAALLHFTSPGFIPQWASELSMKDEEADIIIINHNWFPRFKLLALPVGNIWPENTLIYQISTNESAYDIYLSQIDILPEISLLDFYVNRAMDFMTVELNRDG